MLYPRGFHSHACANLQSLNRMPLRYGQSWSHSAVRRCLCRCPSVEATAVASIVLSAALEVCRERGGDHIPAAAAVQLALHAHLVYLNTGAAHCLKAAFRPCL